ncbi:hypothetical protein ESP131_16310 [Exiguobacterium sp. U13-1]|uniref:Uncharacterized protein n=1 Tax=Exiguobacterium acetylicum TaxID=41170 RepID=A0ABX8G8L3_EXIAC|nr:MULTISPECIES: hypothetical protein [Exiguobacterium]AOT01762.1 hypothetical protein ESP131_16310 [Exiguobacterium sp. U13-1]QWB29716.1 hypothetical protein KKI46_14145 [Exiguobacterium acetylicum]HCD57854.1 hypothetical protein [Exiguobacterium sp.]
MKKVVIATALGLIISTLPVASDSVAALSKTEKTIVDRQLAALKKSKLSGGYKPVDVRSVYLLGGKYPETFTLYERFNSNTYMNDVIGKAQKYDAKKKKWTTIYTYTDRDTDYYDVRAKGKLLDTKKEQLVIGPSGGSGGYIVPILIGSTDGKMIKKMFESKEAYPFGRALIKDKKLYVGSMTIVHDVYSYNGKTLKHRVGTGADDRIVAGKVSNYMTLDYYGGSTHLTSGKTMTLKKGQRFGIVRKSTKDTNPYVYRAFSSGEGKLQLDGYGFKAIKTGVEKWHFEPDAYSDAITMKFTVK